MKCSNCSEVIKPIVAVDIDGVLGDYHGHFLSFAETYLGRECCYHTHYTGDEKFSEWCGQNFHIDIATYREVKLAYRQGGMKRSMPIFDGARVLCWTIRDAGAELWLTTTRPYLSLDGVIKDTHEWLRRHEIEMDGLLFDDDKYRTLFERVDPLRVVAIFDDQFEYINSAAVIFGFNIPVLVRGRYNSSVTATFSCDLDAAIEVSRDRIIRWTLGHV